jgi:ubiquinone/menaquinone biosynthesis C-methylase UbiE
MAKDPTRRFSDRVEDYRKYRPGYPAAVLDHLAARCGLGPDSVVADIGSGTGILTANLLTRAARVHAVEPNAPMRKAAESDLASHPGFASVSGTAEATGLPAASVDLITAAQAFHWFDPAKAKAKAEFARILRKPGNIALLWNERHIPKVGFQAAYDKLLKDHVGEYKESQARSGMAEEIVAAFYAPGKAERIDIPNGQDMDFATVQGRLLSASYCPKPGHPAHDLVMTVLKELFEAHQRGGKVRFEYTTRLFVPA